MAEVYTNYGVVQSGILKLNKCSECFTTYRQVLAILADYEIGSRFTHEPLLFLAN